MLLLENLEGHSHKARSRTHGEVKLGEPQDGLVMLQPVQHIEQLVELELIEPHLHPLHALRDRREGVEL